MPAPLLGGAGGGLVHGKSVVVMQCAVKPSAGTMQRIDGERPD